MAATAIVVSGLWVGAAPPAEAAVVPITYEDYFATGDGKQLTVAAPGVLDNDFGVRPGYRAQLVETQLDGNASVELHEDGSFVFTPSTTGDNLTNQFSYCVSTASSTDCASNTQWVNVYVGGTTATTHSHLVAAGGTLTVDAPGLLTGAVNPDPGNTLMVTRNPEHGQVQIQPDGAFTYTPDDGFIGSDRFLFCLSGNGSDCVGKFGYATIGVYPTPEDQTIETDQGTPIEGRLYPFPGVDPGPQFAGLVTSGAQHGTIDVNSLGGFTYTPDAGYAGPDAFSFCISRNNDTCLNDERGAVSVTIGDSGPVAIATTTTLAGPGTVFYGQTAELTATVVPDVDVGEVAFSSGGTLVPDCHAIPVTDSAAICTVPVAALGIGDHTFTAQYSGAGDFQPSTSPPATVMVNPAPTALAYTGDTSGTLGTPMEVSADLTSTAEGATGPIVGQPVRFSMADGLNCTAHTDATGAANCTLTPNRVGSLAVSVSTSGDPRYQDAYVEGVATVAVPSTTTVRADPNPVPWGENVALTATVTTGATGTVAFDIAGTAIAGCAAVPVADGGAVCVADGLEVGSPEVTATYSGDDTYARSSGSTTVQVTQRAVDLAYAGLPTGVVGDVYEIVGTATDALTGEPVAGLFLYLSFQGLTCGEGTDAAGIGSCHVRLKRAGTSDATVQFDGDARYAAATGSGPVTISKAISRTTSTVDVTDPEFGDPVTITASVLPTDGGTVAFNDGGEPLAGCDAVPLVSSGGGSADPWIATCTTRTLAVGPHTLESIFSGTDNYARSAGSTFTMVSAAPSALTYTGQTGGTVGAPLSVSAALTTGDDAAALTGQTVAFTWGELSCTATTGDDGTATCELPITAAAQAGTLTATFAGTDNYLESSATADISVAASSTSTVVTAPETAAFGTEVTIDAVVTPSEGAGTIAFTVADAPIAGCEAVTPTQLDGTWTARCGTSTLPLGANDIAAVFSGTADYLTSFGTTAVTIEAAPTTLTYTGPTSGTVGASLPVSAVLTNAATDTALAGQTVEFGWGELTCTATTGDDGAASCELPTTATAQAGELTVSFAGTTEYTASSATADISVDPAATTLDYLGDTDAMAGTPLAVSAGISLIESATPATARDQPGDGLHRSGTFLTAAAPAAMELAGLRLQFALGAATCEGITDAGGVASCSLNPTAADEQAELIVTFAGTADLTAAELAVRLAVAAAPVPPAEPTEATTTTAPTAPPSTTSGPRSSDPDSSSSASSSSASSSSASSAAVATPANPPSAGGLATTGVDIGGWVRAALLLLGVGALLLLAGRFGRRRTGPRLH